MLEISCLSKRFGSTHALKGVDLRIARGEIHGLVGMNGSGKSTLLNILSGSPVIGETGGHEGRILLDGRALEIRSPLDALGHGIGMIHQESVLIPGMTVAENIFLGRENTCGISGGVPGRLLAPVKSAREKRDAEDALKTLGIKIDTGIKAGDLSLGLERFVTIAREIRNPGLRLLMLDEPTAVAGSSDAARLIETLRRIALGGTAILYVSHRIREVLDLCRNLTVLRSGRVVGRYAAGEVDPAAVSGKMTGKRVIKTRRRRPAPPGGSAVTLRGFSARMPSGHLEKIDLSIKEGEILGVTGLPGQGKSALAAGIMGICPTRGTVIVRGRAMEQRTPSAMIGQGIFLLPEERGLLADHSVMENIVFTAFQARRGFEGRFPRGLPGLLDRKAAARYAERCVERFDIRCRSIFQKAGELSGGNQQKVSVARILAPRPSILLVAEPTRGIDPDAREKILEALVSFNTPGKRTVMITSGDMEMLERVCHRIVILHKGGIGEIISPGMGRMDSPLMRPQAVSR